MYYHFAILLLFRPFIKLRFIGSDVVPRDICSQAADAISALARSYSRLYTLRQTPSFVPYFVLTSSIIHAVILADGASSPQQLLQGVADLKEMGTFHIFAVRALDILQYLVHYWQIDIGINGSYGEGQVRELRRRFSILPNQFRPDIDLENMVQSIKLVSTVEENPLFLPFPMQGWPLLLLGAQLTQDGFDICS